MKRFFKNFLRSKLGQNVLSLLGYLYIQLVYRTSRWDYKNRHIIEEYLKTDRPFMVCFWHGRLMMLPLAWQWGRPFKMLISEHGDGTIIGKVVRYFKLGWVAGSTTRGGAKASLALIQLSRGGTIIGITPDGPRGPACRVSRGTVALARWTQADLIPVTFSVRNGRYLKTWDRFLIPRPFTRGVFSIGTPIPYAKEGDDSQTIEALEEALNSLNAEADEGGVL